MTFQWIEFVKYSDKVCNNFETSNEAEIRSAISRAYYGCYHLCKNFLSINNIYIIQKIPNPPFPLRDLGSHEQISETLKNHKEYNDMGIKLERLKSLRHWADYRPDQRNNQKVIIEVNDLSRKIIDKLSSLGNIH